MVDNSPPADLLSEHERVLKNLHDSQLGKELAKKIQAELEAEFARQQEELAQKAQAESVASPTAHGQGMSDQRRRELDDAQFIYTEADWLDLLAKIATNSALSKQLLGDDVTEENMNEQLGMLLMRKRHKLAEQSRVKPMTKTQQRDYMRDFVKNCSASVASVYNQRWTIKKVKTLSIDQLRQVFKYIQRHLERSNLLNFRCSTFRPKPTLDAPPVKRANQEAPQVPAVSTQDPAGVPAAPSIPVDPSLPAASSSDPAAIPVPAVSIAHAAVFVPAKPMVHSAESYMDDPLTAPEHGSSEPTVAAPTQSSSRNRRKHIAKKRVTPIVDVADAAMIKFESDSNSDDDPLPYTPYAGWEMVPSPLCSIHAYHNMAGHTKHFTTLREILHMMERTDLQRLLGAVDALYQSEEPNTFALLLWGDLHVLFQSLDDTNALHFWLQEQTALGKDESNPLTVGSLLKTTWSSIHHLLTDEVLTSPEQTATDQMLLSHDPAVLGVLAGFVLLLFDILSEVPHYDTYHEVEHVDSQMRGMIIDRNQQVKAFEKQLSVEQVYWSPVLKPTPPMSVEKPTPQKFFPKNFRHPVWSKIYFKRLRIILTNLMIASKTVLLTPLLIGEIGGMNHIKDAYEEEVIPLVKNLRESFELFEMGLYK
nr:JmjC domain-containing protein [Tanacetum cinerariifolium]